MLRHLILITALVAPLAAAEGGAAAPPTLERTLEPLVARLAAIRAENDRAARAAVEPALQEADAATRLAAALILVRHDAAHVGALSTLADARIEPPVGTRVLDEVVRAQVLPVARTRGVAWSRALLPPLGRLAEQLDPTSDAGVLRALQAQRQVLAGLRATLAAEAEAGDASAWARFAGHFPEDPAVARHYAGQGTPPPPRTWWPPVDRAVMAHGLGGLDPLRRVPATGPSPERDGATWRIAEATTWRLPQAWEACRLEVVLRAPAGGELALLDDQGGGVRLGLGADGALRVRAGAGTDLGGVRLPAALGDDLHALQITWQAESVTVLYAGLPLWHGRVGVRGCTQLRLAPAAGATLAGDLLQVRWLSGGTP